MLDWHSYTNSYYDGDGQVLLCQLLARENNILIYKVLYFIEKKYYAALSILPTGKWLPKNLHLTYKNGGVIYDLPDCQFATIEEAKKVCERYHKLLLLQ